MEPFRVLVDRKVRSSCRKPLKKTKASLVDILNAAVEIDNTKQTVLNAIRIYSNRIFESLNKTTAACSALQAMSYRL